MKKLFTLLGALLLGQAMAVAQNYLHISQGDSAIAVPIAQLDSVTVRQTEFYEPLYLCQGVFYDSFFYNNSFEVSVYTLGDKLIVKDADVYEGFTFTNNRSSEIFVVEEQKTSYNHSAYGIIRVLGNGTYSPSDDSFYFDLQYIVDAGSFGTYPVVLQLNRSIAAPVRDRNGEGVPKATSELKATLQAKGLQDDKATHMQLQPMNSREITQ